MEKTTKKFFKTHLLITTFLLPLLHINAQEKNLNVSESGIDSIKIGMSIQEVEKAINDTLQRFDLLDSISKSLETFTCIYQGISFQLIFSKFTEKEYGETKLLTITPMTFFAKLETLGGIKTGIARNEFIQICKKNNYRYTDMYSGKFSSAYYLSSATNTSPAAFITVAFVDEKIAALGVLTNIQK